MTTHDYHGNTTSIPATTPQSLIFPYDQVSNTFSTINYMPLQTQNRVPLEEVEQFLEQVNVPMKQVRDKYEWFTDTSCKFICLMLICFILFPLFFFFICWFMYTQNQVGKKLEEATEKSKIFIRDNNKHFIERGLMWNVPLQYPQWIELWTTIPGAKFDLPGVHTGVPIAKAEYDA